MDVYYRRIETWCKWPDNDVIDQKYVVYSTSKRKFERNVFMRTDVSPNTEERRSLVAEHFDKKPSKIKLIKF